MFLGVYIGKLSYMNMYVKKQYNAYDEVINGLEYRR